MSNLGIAAISVYRPSLVLNNDWFGERLPRKFVQHTGTHSRLVSSMDEVAMAEKAIAQLQQEVGCDLQDCAGIVFVSPSYIPRSVTRKHLPRSEWRSESLARATFELSCKVGLLDRWRCGLNWFCSGYAKALAKVEWRCKYAAPLTRNQFILVVTSSRISRITDYRCAQTGPLFGDLSTVTLMAPIDSPKYPVQFEMRYSHAERQAAPGVYFDFESKRDVLHADGSISAGVVFKLDGLGIADIAPRAMANALSKAISSDHLSPLSVKAVVPHQAGTGIVRFASLKIEALGVKARVINGVTSEVGNVSSGSIPFALKNCWNELDGVIACPAAGVGPPGKSEVTQGCVILERCG